MDLLQLLALEREHMRSKEGKHLAGPETVEQMEEVLAGLEEIGAVHIGRDDGVSLDNDPPLSTLYGTSGGGGEGGESGGPIGPEGDDGGAGLSEILGHAVLFCLSEGAQDALIEAAFNTGPPEEGVHG